MINQVFNEIVEFALRLIGQFWIVNFVKDFTVPANTVKCLLPILPELKTHCTENYAVMVGISEFLCLVSGLAVTAGMILSGELSARVRSRAGQPPQNDLNHRERTQRKP